jgi:hypothetical protein
MIERGNPGRGTPSSSQPARTERTGYALANYLKTLKAAAHERGLHISKRVVWIEGFLNEFSTMLRMLENLDAEVAPTMT